MKNDNCPCGTPIAMFSKSGLCDSCRKREWYKTKSPGPCERCGVATAYGNSSTNKQGKLYCKACAQFTRKIEFTLEWLLERIEVSTTQFYNGSPCWNWTKAKTEEGYATTIWGGCHRQVWKLHKGDIPSKHSIDHLCFNPSCQNIEHMELVTYAENSRRSRIATNLRERTHCSKGHEYTEENTYWRKNKPTRAPARRCKTCKNENMRRLRAEGKCK